MLRVNAVNELPALSRMREAGALDCEGSSRIAASLLGPDPGVRGRRLERLSLRGTQLDQSPGIYLGGSIVLVKSRHVRERRLRPQAGCHVQPFNATPVNAPRRFGCASGS